MAALEFGFGINMNSGVRILNLVTTLAVSVFLITPANQLYAHGGRTDGTGCHNDRKNGGRHCHNGSSKPTPVGPLTVKQSESYYSNCDAARAAGVAPLQRSDPGYAAHLDRDNDGIACEPYHGR